MRQDRGGADGALRTSRAAHPARNSSRRVRSIHGAKGTGAEAEEGDGPGRKARLQSPRLGACTLPSSLCAAPGDLATRELAGGVCGDPQLLPPEPAPAQAPSTSCGRTPPAVKRGLGVSLHQAGPTIHQPPSQTGWQAGGQGRGRGSGQRPHGQRSPPAPLDLVCCHQGPVTEELSSPLRLPRQAASHARRC